jgi:nucleoporin GLE1
MWEVREKEIWARIEDGIRWEEERVRREEEEEQKRVEEEEKVRREAERVLREEEERRRVEEERVREEERRVMEEKQRVEEERRREEELVKARREAEKAEEEQRKALGMITAEEDWKHARITLKVSFPSPVPYHLLTIPPQGLKSGPMRTVKSTKQLKSTWLALRRQITPKIGQLTNDLASIERISSQLYNLLVPSSANPNPLSSAQLHPEEIYIPLLSALAKAILLQAETEVTASKAAAVPLAVVTKNLLSTLPHFEDVLFAKLVQRVGAWGVPTSLPRTDINLDGTDSNEPFEEVSARKAMGYRDVPSHKDDEGKKVEEQREPQGEYILRVAGIMRVYFLVLLGAGGVPDRPMQGRMWQTGRFWGYFARMLGGYVGGMGSAVAAEILYGLSRLPSFPVVDADDLLELQSH